ncbi:ABC transporter [candidate division MSBL1 archaeon SCGC-AAA259E19]|uniref:Molybdate/tungstate import ATP-binding protein WtpC n=1 Tax=candidate division MSBL1 archaeon SCGC-AAA259E19 TaxID=1698264 RepID=A0A133UJT6_9EURY|nr:ABC transporter [candidate division MSBL1 archaeon SCGC-AAA259E19]
MIGIENISKDWPNFSLKNINLKAKNKEYFVILGPTGAGKTLLLELIAGFYKPDEGRIFLGEEDVTFENPEDRDVGFVYQDYSLFPHLTVEENIKYGLEVNDFSKDAIREKTKHIVNLLEISHLTEHYPKTLSGGEQQKTALARGLIMDPEILLLDEPISALDKPSQERMREELKRIHRKAGITTIHVTHNREEASWLGDRIGVMNRGKIVQVGTPSEVFREPKSEFVADFVGTENIFKGTSVVKNGIAQIDIGKGIKLEAVTDKEGEVTACIRPEEILLSKDSFKSSGSNVFKGKVVDIIELENTFQIRIDAGQNFSIVITKRSKSDMKIEKGSKVYLTFKASAVHVL